MEELKQIALLFEKLGQKKPLVNSITNCVTINDVANTLLSIGAAPIMSAIPQEIEEVMQIADCLYINIGDFDKNMIEAIFTGGNVAKKLKKPIVFDPVAVGATKARNQLSLEIMEKLKPEFVRGNLAEISFFSKTKIKPKGVDVGEEAQKLDPIKITEEVAQTYQTIVLTTGEQDICSDGKSTFVISGASPLMSQITGTGCMLSAVVGAFGVIENSVFAPLTASFSFKFAAEEALKKGVSTPMALREALIDGLYAIKEKDILNTTLIKRVS